MIIEIFGKERHNKPGSIFLACMSRALYRVFHWTRGVYPIDEGMSICYPTAIHLGIDEMYSIMLASGHEEETTRRHDDQA
jgi:hypothetical protein